MAGENTYKVPVANPAGTTQVNVTAPVAGQDGIVWAADGRLVDLDTEADFIARDALTRVRDEGVKQKIVGVEIDGDRLEMNATDWPVSADGASGRVTSAVYSPRLEKNIGYAWLPVEHTELGTHVAVETPEGMRDATIAPLPFFDPEKQIPKS